MSSDIVLVITAFLAGANTMAALAEWLMRSNTKAALRNAAVALVLYVVVAHALVTP